MGRAGQEHLLRGVLDPGQPRGALRRRGGPRHPVSLGAARASALGGVLLTPVVCRPSFLSCD